MFVDGDCCLCLLVLFSLLLTNRHIIVLAFLFYLLFIIPFYFPAQVARYDTLSDLLDKPRSQVGVFSSLPRHEPFIFIYLSLDSAFPLFSFSMLVDFRRILLTHALALSATNDHALMRIRTRIADFCRGRDSPITPSQVTTTLTRP